MIKFAVVKFFRQKPYKKIVLSEEEAWLLGFQEKDNKILIPSGGTLHHFVKYRLNVEGIDKIMMMVGERIRRLQNINHSIVFVGIGDIFTNHFSNPSKRSNLFSICAITF